MNLGQMGCICSQQVNKVNSLQKCSNCDSDKFEVCLYRHCESPLYYCLRCKQKFNSIHKKNYHQDPYADHRKRSLEGRVGLQNIGNTCYLNSCIQCLSHTQQLTKYFLNKYYKQEINLENIFGLSGEFAHTYYTCIQNLWIKSNLTFRPFDLKKIIGKKNQQFSSYQQQDACQLFTTVIDGIHQDLNRSKKRVNTLLDDISGKIDSEGAQITWLHYLINNQSIIVDIMTGISKSAIVCQNCNKEEKKFDLFNMISLPIPEDYQNKKFPLNCLFVITDSRKEYELLKRPFFIDWKQQSGLSLTKTLLKFLFLFCYTSRQEQVAVHAKQYNQYQGQMLKKCPFKLFLTRKIPQMHSITQIQVFDQNIISERIKCLQINIFQSGPSLDKKIQLRIEISYKNNAFDFFQLKDQIYQQKKIQNIQNKQLDLYDCFNAYQAAEDFNGQFNCQSCQNSTKITKRMQIYKTPNVLVLVLNRFKFTNLGTRTKNNKLVNFPMELDLRKYVIDPLPVSSYLDIAEQQKYYQRPTHRLGPGKDKGQIFKLYGVINHFGSLNSGHYNAYAKNGSKWYLFDDSRVTEVEQLSPKNAYMLFYQRKTEQ